MQIDVRGMEDIASVVRQIRKSQGIRQDDLGSMAGCSHKFIVDVEKGKQTIQAGLLLKVLDELGIRLIIDLPDSSHAQAQNTAKPL
jgi:y4mF family transcriptional regulator